jgi:hypothetical protein
MLEIASLSSKAVFAYRAFVRMGLAGGSVLVELCVGEFAWNAFAVVEVVEVPARFQI